VSFIWFPRWTGLKFHFLSSIFQFFLWLSCTPKSLSRVSYEYSCRESRRNKSFAACIAFAYCSSWGWVIALRFIFHVKKLTNFWLTFVDKRLRGILVALITKALWISIALITMSCFAFFVWRNAYVSLLW
jgi:hypothetical protein